MKRVRKAVLPVAGFGTRFLPATKSVPKEMLTIVDKPIIQYVVDEAREAGIEHIIFVTGRNKHVIEDYFDVAYELERSLADRGQQEALGKLEQMRLGAGMASFTRQQVPLGLGHAIWCARDMIGDEPFAILLPDMLLKSEPGCLSQMLDVHQVIGDNMVSVEAVAPEMVHNYGIIEFESAHASATPPRKAIDPYEANDNRLFQEIAGQSGALHRCAAITALVEKPVSSKAPSSFALNGRYILNANIMPILEEQDTGRGGEIQLTDAMATLMQEQKFHAMHYNGKTFDCGSRFGFLTANISYALEDDDLALRLQHIFTK